MSRSKLLEMAYRKCVARTWLLDRYLEQLEVAIIETETPVADRNARNVTTLSSPALIALAPKSIHDGAVGTTYRVGA